MQSLSLLQAGAFAFCKLSDSSPLRPFRSLWLNLKIEVHAEARKHGERQISVKEEVPFPNSAPPRPLVMTFFSLNFEVSGSGFKSMRFIGR
ncbi:MAG: hypothetical protein EBR81_02530 [Proteobacteria bacterium]|nr:hypothetical protein [Pseudomonadota bacterium]